MNISEPSLQWLEDPRIFQVNRREAHSDHRWYDSEAHMKEDKMIWRQSLNGTWKFSYASCPSVRKTDFYKKDYDVRDFGEIQVPGHIQMQGYDRCQYINTMYPWDGQEELRPPHISSEYNPVGSYVRFFQVDKALKGMKTILSFQGGETAFYVWLNGEFVGYGEDSFTPSEFDVTEYLTAGENKLAVEVYKRSSASWLEDQDFWRFSGIFRDVYLYGIPELHVQDLFLQSGLEDDYKTGTFLWQANLEGMTDQATAEAVLLDQNGKVCFQEKKKVKGVIDWQGRIEEISPWSGENPYLYELRIYLCNGAGSLIEVVKEQIGFRRFEMKNEIMHLNGKRIIFRGVNRHEFNARRGRAVTMEDMLWDIEFLKRHNINAVRTSHYPNHSEWYRLCDRYGIYLIDEANLETHGSWQKMGTCDPSWNVPGSLPEWEDCVVDRAKSMLERDKNHPSILIWSCGNESYAGKDILSMAEYFRDRDCTRLVHYEGVFWNREFDQISDMESRMYAKPAEIEDYLKTNPKKPYISCEYMHAMGNSCGGMKLYTDLEDKYEKYQGGFIWDYIDQSIYKINELGEEVLTYGGDFDDRATDYEFCGNGIVYADRRPTPKAQEVKGLYANLRLIPDCSGVKIENRNCFITTEDYQFQYRLYRNGICIFEDKMQTSISPLESAYIHLDYPKQKEVGEYTYEVSAVLFEDCMWAEAGYEIAFGQFVTRSMEQPLEQEDVSGKKENTESTENIGIVENTERIDDSVGNKLKVIHGDVNIGVRGEGFLVMFSKAEGGMASLQYDGIEYITRAPKVSFWRACTDNDRGAGYDFAHSSWMTAGLFQKLEKVQVNELENQVQIAFTWRLQITPATFTDTIYTVYPDGRIHTEIVYHGVEGLANLPAFGMDIRLKSVYDKYKFYGMGPEENYRDRCAAARLGIYEGTAKENLSPYLMPQECGNHMGTRWLEVSDGNGKGLKFTYESQPFEHSVLPCSAYELELAKHQEELPKPHYTWVRILESQMGVGGDDSWGAPVHEEYLLSSDQDRRLVFTIGRLG